MVEDKCGQCAGSVRSRLAGTIRCYFVAISLLSIVILAGSSRFFELLQRLGVFRRPHPPPFTTIYNDGPVGCMRPQGRLGIAKRTQDGCCVHSQNEPDGQHANSPNEPKRGESADLAK
jgi:hypothetical protein